MEYSVGYGCAEPEKNDYEKTNIVISLSFDEDELKGIKNLSFMSVATFDMEYEEDEATRIFTKVEKAMVPITNVLSDNKAKQLLGIKKIQEEGYEFSHFKLFPKLCTVYDGYEVSDEYYFNPKAVPDSPHYDALFRGFFTTNEFCYLHNLIQFKTKRVSYASKS